MVEFAQVGNAAYIYSNETFDLKFKQFAERRRELHNLSWLKDQNIALERILHGGYWQGKADRIMMKLLGGK